MSQLTTTSRPPMAPNASAKAGGAEAPQRHIRPPSIPSNLQRDADQDVVFNSIGFYSDLLSRLDNQIKSTETVFVASQMRVT